MYANTMHGRHRRRHHYLLPDWDCVLSLYIECGRATQNNMDDIKQTALMGDKRKREMGKNKTGR